MAHQAPRRGDFAARIEHVGSTSVPGLAAKPRIDIQVSVPDLTREDRYVAQIEAVLQVHVCNTGSRWEADHLIVRRLGNRRWPTPQSLDRRKPR
jgi:GrpB-like predicted nucleotidyltransferase (UPF0157 family)